MAKEYKLTRDRLKELEAELHFLKTIGKTEVAEQIKEARSFGDLSENSEYDEAKNEQAKIEAQISELEETLAHVKVIGDHEIQTNTVSIGVSVVLYDIEEDEEIEYHLVSSREVNPLENKISDQSPLGKAIIGAKVGDIVTAEVPVGTIKVKIVDIKKNDEENKTGV